MNRSGLYLTAALVVALSCSALAAQDKGDAGAPKGKKDDKILTKDKMLTAGTLSGTLVKLDEDKKFSLSVTYYDIDAGKVQANQQHYVNRLTQINQLTNLVEAQRQLAQLQAEMVQRNQNIYHKVTKDVELQAEDNVKVRSLKPLVKYDDKGEIVQYSKEDLKKLAAGGPKLPGVGPTYPAAYDKLQTQQKLIVYLAKSKAPPPPAKKGADATGGELFQSRPRVVAIVIAEEVAPPK